MLTLDIIALISVVYKVKSTGPSIEPCRTPYENVTLSDRVSSIFRIIAHPSTDAATTLRAPSPNCSVMMKHTCSVISLHWSVELDSHVNILLF